MYLELEEILAIFLGTIGIVGASVGFIALALHLDAAVERLLTRMHFLTMEIDRLLVLKTPSLPQTASGTQSSLQSHSVRSYSMESCCPVLICSFHPFKVSTETPQDMPRKGSILVKRVFPKRGLSVPGRYKNEDPSTINRRSSFSVTNNEEKISSF